MTFRMFGGRRLTVALVVGAAVAAAAFASAISAATASRGRAGSHGRDSGQDRGRHHETYTIGLFGDMPYGALGRSQYPNLLADINRSHVAFSIFDGDLQAGGDGPCNDSLYSTALANSTRCSAR